MNDLTILPDPQPQPELERTAIVRTAGDRRAIHLIFELKPGWTVNRCNLLLAKIYAGTENDEREVDQLSEEIVDDLVRKFKEGPAGA